MKALVNPKSPAQAMASLTPGVLSKLLQNAGNRHAKVTGEHRSALLQVIEIVPAPAAADQPPWQSRGFFLKLSDSLHSAYVSISDDDIDLIHSDKIQLGQFVYVAWLDSGSPVPVLRGLKSVPKRRPCVGNPTDLLSTDLLAAKEKVKRLVFDDGKPKRSSKVGDGLELRRLSLDSTRRAWDHGAATPKSAPRTPRVKSKHTLTSADSASVCSEKKASPRRDSLLLKSPSLNNSPLKNKNDIFVPKSTSKPLRKEVKPSCEDKIPTHLTKVPFGSKPISDQKISWDALPLAIYNLGKETVSHRNASFFTAVQALEEASASDGVINCMCAFSKLCESSQQVAAGQLVDRFLELHQSMQRASMVVTSLINTKASLGTTPPCSPTDISKSLTNKNAASWVQAAIDSDLSNLSVFKKKSEIVKGESCHVVIIENSPKDSSLENRSPRPKQSPRGQGALSSDSSAKAIRTPPQRNMPVKKKTDSEGSGSGLKETAILAQKLLLASREWFLKYLEGSLGREFGLREEEGSSETMLLLRQLKGVNQWLDDLVGCRVETDERIEVLRKKLYRFLLEHVDSTV